MSEQPKFIRVTTRLEDDGVVVYTDESGRDVALKLPKTGRVADLRERPLFLSMSPCPYCDALNDRGHDPLKHIDPFLGEKVR